MAEIKGSYVAGTSTITANTNIAFKLGTQASLENLPKAQVQNGAFYLTSDTHRLYIGNSDGSVSPVNQGIIPVDDTKALTNIVNPIPGQFYYALEGNIIATWSGNRWVQLNPDTYVDGMWDTVTATADGIKIVTTIQHAGGQDNQVESDATVNGEAHTAVHIDSGDKIKVSTEADSNHIVISTGDYGLTTDGSENNVNIGLTYTDPDGLKSTEEKINITATNGIKITQANDALVFDGSDLLNQANDQNITAAAFSNKDAGFQLTLTKGDGSDITASVDPQITYGKADYGTGQHTHSFANGINTLHVYTVEQVDKLVADSLMDFNALTYKGTVGETGATVKSLPQIDVKVGDVYMGDGSVAVKLTANGTAELYDAGTLFIATGAEGVDGNIAADGVTWTRVQNYNADTITTVDMGTPKKISIGNSIVGGANSGNTEHLGSFAVDASGVLTATDSITGKDRVVTITHNTYAVNHQTVTEDTLDNEKHLWVGKALTNVTNDAYGHLQSTAESKITIPTEVFSEAATTSDVAVNTSNVATLSDTLTLLNSNSNAEISAITTKHQVTSETLVLTAKDQNTLKMDLMWGSF